MSDERIVRAGTTPAGNAYIGIHPPSELAVSFNFPTYRRRFKRFFLYDASANLDPDFAREVNFQPDFHVSLQTAGPSQTLLVHGYLIEPIADDDKPRLAVGPLFPDYRPPQQMNRAGMMGVIHFELPQPIDLATRRGEISLLFEQLPR